MDQDLKEQRFVQGRLILRYKRAFPWCSRGVLLSFAPPRFPQCHKKNPSQQEGPPSLDRVEKRDEEQKMEKSGWLKPPKIGCFWEVFECLSYKTKQTAPKIGAGQVKLPKVLLLSKLRAQAQTA